MPPRELTFRGGTLVFKPRKRLCYAELFRVLNHRGEFAAGCVDNDACLREIGEVFAEKHYLLDPHTAVALKVAKEHRSERPMLVASTAHWAKFGPNVWRGLNGLGAHDELPAEVASLSGIALNRAIAEATDTRVPAGLEALETLPRRFDTVVEASKAGVEDSVLGWLEKH